jgi:sterol desaturase/sphingolipid hydroxylase (fatty acid hydroxylase superfamily)
MTVAVIGAASFAAEFAEPSALLVGEVVVAVSVVVLWSLVVVVLSVPVVGVGTIFTGGIEKNHQIPPTRTIATIIQIAVFIFFIDLEKTYIERVYHGP